MENTAAFHAGDKVLVIHPVTEAWIGFRIKAGSAIRTERVVQAVHGDAVTR